MLSWVPLRLFAVLLVPLAKAPGALVLVISYQVALPCHSVSGREPRSICFLSLLNPAVLLLNPPLLKMNLGFRVPSLLLLAIGDSGHSRHCTPWFC